MKPIDQLRRNFDTIQMILDQSKGHHHRLAAGYRQHLLDLQRETYDSLQEAGHFIWKEWDGEYNEHRAIVKGQIIQLYSDRDGKVWRLTIGTGEDYELFDANTLERATMAANRILAARYSD